MQWDLSTLPLSRDVWRAMWTWRMRGRVRASGSGLELGSAVGLRGLDLEGELLGEDGVVPHERSPIPSGMDQPAGADVCDWLARRRMVLLAGLLCSAR